jgi:hypothetical protein
MYNTMADKMTGRVRGIAMRNVCRGLVGKGYKIEDVYWCDMTLLAIIGLLYRKINVTENKLILLCPDEGRFCARACISRDWFNDR